MEQDHSWGLVETSVLELVHEGRRLILKAAGPADHHIGREIEAHTTWLTPWVLAGRAPALVFADAPARMLVTTFLPGQLVLGSGHQTDPTTYHQAGTLLAQLHAQPAVEDAGYEERENRKALSWLDQPHRIAADVVDRLRSEIASWPTPPVSLVPTHGDWQPRNWLVHEGVVSIIDFGRAALRPAMSDLARLSAQDFRGDSRLEVAFLDGYGGDPREPGAWLRLRVREAIGTATWAFGVGDEPFEAQGHRMIAEALADLDRVG